MEMGLRCPEQLSLEYIPMMRIEYYPKSELGIEQKWTCYSVQEIEFRITSSLITMKRQKSSIRNIERVARACFELGVKTEWNTTLDPEWLAELKELSNKAKIRLDFSIGHLRSFLMELGPENENIEVEQAIWGCLLTSGIMHLGKLINNQSMARSGHLRSCLRWVLANCPYNLIGLEYVRQSGID